MSFFKKLFCIKANPQTETINIFGKDYVIDVSHKAMELRQKDYEEDKKNSWIGTNEIERIREDGYVIYKSNRVSFVEQEQIGIYGLKWYSENNNYCAVYLPHSDEEFNLGLVDVRLKKVIYKIKLQRLHRCRVTNEGVIVCEDWGGYESPSCYVYVLDINGNQTVKKRHNTGIGDIFELIENETMFRYSLNQTGEIYIIDNLKIKK